MAYDEELADRIRARLGAEPGLSEKKMFGGIAFLINGNMACGVNQDDLIVRVDTGSQAEVMSEPGARDFDMTGRPMMGWVAVDRDGYGTDDDLVRWVERGRDYARRLPPK